MRLRQAALLSGLLLTTCTCALPLLGGLQPLERGTAASEFALPSLTGETVSLSDFAGQPLLLNFWTTT